MTNELYHYGVLGMKWGVRRYQNKDGSLTAAGRRRYDTNYADERAANNKDMKYIVTANRKAVYDKYSDKYPIIKESFEETDRAFAEDAEVFQKVRDRILKHPTVVSGMSDLYEDDVLMYVIENPDALTEEDRKIIGDAYDVVHQASVKAKNVYENRAAVMVGEDWFNRYTSEMKRAGRKDYRETLKRND